MQDKYNIHPDFKRFPVITLKFGTLSLWIVNSLMRLQCFFVRRRLSVSIADHVLSQPDGSRYKVMVMTPRDLQGPAPALVYFHGGAFAITYSSLHLRNCERYANEAGCVVIFVDYRLAPRYRFPSGFDDCYRSLEWTISQAAELGVDPTRIAVGGDSAGGAMAAGVAQKARDEQLVTLCAQLLIYPVLDHTCSTNSATEFVDVPLWNANSNRNMWRMYLGRTPDQEAPAYAAPGHGALKDLPLSYVETAEYDPLRDEGLQHANDLEAKGIDVVVNETKQTIHGYDGNAGSDIAQRSISQRIRFLRRAFSANAAHSTHSTQPPDATADTITDTHSNGATTQ